jgi:hypothetical protein
MISHIAILQRKGVQDFEIASVMPTKGIVEIFDEKYYPNL